MRTLLLLISFLIFSFTSKASAYWMEIKGSGKLNYLVTVQLIYGNIDDLGIRHRQTGRELSLTGEFKLNLIDPSGNKTDLKLTLKNDCWEAYFTPKLKGIYRILGLNDTHPVVDRSKIGGENILPIDYLRSNYQVEVENYKSTPSQFLDILIQQKGDLVIVKAYNDGKQAKKNTKLRVFNPQNWEKELTLDENGEATFSISTKGMYVIRQDFVDSKAGNYKGIPYTSIRHRCNYCLFIK
ncbi:hypothetical protein [Pedobacter nototheniae]|uniref:hypothetical protein n=1 Tax=Pedobacter nototheniae TaxID=2488994 RepID=UPI00103A57EF|nr:hypothetical protein [Pedobacter nototheniae]